MKHSSSSSMSETYEVKDMMPGSGNWNNILRNLYVDLFNLIVESRIPGINERGYGNGYHCPPLLGQNVHLCDLMKPECRKHQTMIHHLLRAVRHNVFEIEVLMLPECCSDSKLSERIQRKEYVLLERWSMTFFESDKSQFSIEIPELLRAVRSFLHFSQISAWLSSTKGKSPANIYYWVKPTIDPSSTQFENGPEAHSFPIFKVNEELCGIVRVNYPTRKQYLPIIPCSKHPPLQGLRLRLNEDSDLSSSIPLNQQIVMQLQKSCDNQQSLIAVKHCATDPESLKSSSTTILKTLTQNVNDISKTNRILKHSNLQVALKSSNEIFSNSCGAQISNEKEISSNSDATLCDNYTQNYTKCSSQENLNFDKSISTLMHRNEPKLNLLSKVIHPSFCGAHPIPAELAHQHISRHNVPECCSVSSNLSSSDMCKVTSSVSNLLLASVETSQSSISNVSHDSKSCLGIQRINIQKSLKRKYFTGNELHAIPDKRLCMPEDKFEKKGSLQNELPSSCQNNFLKKPFKRKHCQSSVRSKKASILVKCVQEKNCIDKLSDEKLNIQNSTKTASLNMLCISSESKVIGEKSNQTSENCLNQTYDDSYKNLLSAERNPNSTNKILKLVNSPLKTGCKNQIVSKSLAPDNCLSSNCDILISAKLNSETSKQLSSEFNFNSLEPPKTSYNAKKALKQHNTKCLNNIYNEPFLNDKSDSSSLLSINLSHQMEGNMSTISNLCYNKPHKSNDFQILEGRVKKKYISDFFKSCRLPNLDLSQCTNICMSGSKHAQSLELVKSSATSFNTVGQRFLYSNISTAKVSRRLRLDKFCKRHKKETSQSRLKNSHKYKTSSSFALPHRKEKYMKDQNFNDFVQKQIILENQNSKLNSSTHSLLKQKPSKDSSSDSVSHECVLGDKNKLSFKDNSFKHNFEELSTVLVTSLKKSDSFQIGKKQVFSCYSSHNVLPQKATPYLDCFPRHKLKFARGRKLLGNFEESILKGCLLPVSNVKGFRTEIGASGSFCPNHITLPADVSFYDMDNLCSGASPYMAHVTLRDTEYFVPKKGAVQVTLFNPSETVVKMFVLNYDLSDMPPSCHTFIRQKTYYMPVGSTEESPSSPKWLRFILHLRFASSKTGKLFLHEDFKIVVLNKSNDDAASEFNQEPRELRSFLHVPMNPTFSNF